MRFLKPLIGLALLCLPVAGCSPISTYFADVGHVVTSAKTIYQQVKNYYTDAPKAVYALKGGFIIVQTGVATFKKTECPAVNSQPWCLSVITNLRKLNKATEQAIQTAQDFVLANPNLDASTLYDAAVKAVESYAQYATTVGVPSQ